MSRGAKRRRASEARAVGVRAHWVTLAVVLVAIAAALVVQGYAHHLTSTGGDIRPTASGDPAPEAARDGGPIIDSRGGIDAITPHTDTVALTFDDGPDPT